jgi:hypothetical protein
MIKKIAFTTIISLLVINIVCEISTTHVKPLIEPEEKAVYDSTRNFLGNDVNQYLGQILYLIGKTQDSREYGYKGFIKDYKDDKFYNNPNIYKGFQAKWDYASSYNDLAERYFKVTSVIDCPVDVMIDLQDGTDYYLELVDTLSEETLYYRYDCQKDWMFPFLVVGYYEKQKKEVVGQKFVFTNDLLYGAKDIVTGNLVSNTPRQEWKCLDLTIEEQNYTLSAVLKNSKGESTTLEYEWFHDVDYGRHVFTATESQKYTKKFGIKNWEDILNGKIRVGFTKEMVRLAWGGPKKINQASYGDQWVYEDSYLYFKNGVLTAFN